ncbi:MAG TPA: PAS domain S-box protein, partial [Methanomassiliicoccales archaeon]|nr:PAS domain S-box protein [Methanomassiliicoccales archaeon]
VVDGLARIRAGGVDVVVSDYMMPGMDGLAFLKELRSVGNDIPFILFTGKGREEVVIQALNEGADFYLQKGGEPRPQFAELAHKIRHAVERHTSRYALKLSESRLRRAEEKAKFGHWEYDVDEGIFIASPGTMLIYGLDKQIITKDDAASLPVPEFRDMMVEGMKALIHRGAIYCYDLKVIRQSDGAIIDIHSEAEYDPAIRRVFGIVNDITDRVRIEDELKRKNEELNDSYQRVGMSEEELRQTLDELIMKQMELSESELRFRRVFEILPIGLWLADKDGTLLAGNPAGRKIWEAEPQVGQEGYGVFKAWRLPGRKEIMPDDWALGYAVNEGRVTENELIEIRAFNGKHKLILNWASPLKNDHGETIGAFVINEDITERVRAEEALKESEERHRTLLNNLPSGIVVHAPDTSIIYANSQASRLLGLTFENMQGKVAMDPSWNFFKDDGTPMHLNEFPVMRVLSSLAPVENLVIGSSNNGGDGTIWALVNAYPYFDADGRISQVVVAFNDITERKKMEEKIRQSESELREAQEISQVGRWELNVTNGIISWSEGIFALFEIDRDSIPSYDSFLESVHPDDRVMVDSTYKRSIEQRTTYEMEHRLQMKDGRVKWVSAMGRTDYDPNGRAVRSYGTVQDITDRKQVELRLRETTEYLQKLLDYANAPIIVWDPNYQITTFNHAFERLTGIEARIAVGKTLDILFPEETRSSSMDLIRRTAPGNDWEYVEIPIRGHDGSVRTVLWNSAAIMSAEGKVMATIAQGQDITDRKHFEKELTEREEYLRTILRTTVDGYWVLDSNGRFLDVNDTFVRMSGYAREELLRFGITDIDAN